MKNTRNSSNNHLKKRISNAFIKHLTLILLVISSAHVPLKFFLVCHPQFLQLNNNANNVHYALSCVTVGLLLFLIAAILNDFIFKIYTSFKWIEGLNITLIASCFFISGFLVCYAGEVGFAVFNPFDTCRQLGLNKQFKPDNGTQLTDDAIIEKRKKSCSLAIEFVFNLLAIDFTIMAAFIPFHILVLANSWKFAALYRRRRAVPDSHSKSDLHI